MLLFNIQQGQGSGGGGGRWFITFAVFHGINIPMVANFKLAM